MNAYLVHGDVSVERGDSRTTIQDYTDALVPLTPFLQEGRTYPLFAWMAVDVHAGLQWLAEKQGDAFSAGQHKSDLKIMAQRAMAEAPQAAVMWMKKLDQARAGVLTYSRVAIGEEVGRQLREEGNTEAAATCEEYVSKWKKFAEDAKRAADTAPEATAASQ